MAAAFACSSVLFRATSFTTSVSPSSPTNTSSYCWKRAALPANQRYFHQSRNDYSNHQRSRSLHMSLPSQARNKPIASRIAGAALKLLIQSLCTTAKDVQVDVNASSNMALLSGRLNAVTVTASKLIYNKVSISGGVALYTDEIHLTTSSFASSDSSISLGPFAPTSTPTLAKPFSVSGRATFTESDLNRDGPVRDALQTLLRQIVATGLSGALGRKLPESIGGITCSLDNIRLTDRPSIYKVEENYIDGVIDKVLSWIPWMDENNNEKPQQKSIEEDQKYKDNGSIILEATATLTSGKTIKFDIGAGISIVDDGHVVKLANPHVIWNGVAIPIITISMIGVKLDSTTKITNIVIDNGILSADGILIISPPSPTSRKLSSSY